MISALFIASYVILIVISYLALSCIKGCGYSPPTQLAIIIIAILVVLIIQSFIFCEVYRGIHSTDRNSFVGSDIFKSRKQTEAVKSLWLSKDVSKDSFFPNWLLLELTDYVNNSSNLIVFHSVYKMYYGCTLTYTELRNKLSNHYSDLLARLKPRPLPPNMPAQGNVLDLPGIDEFIIRLSSTLHKHGVVLNTRDRQAPLLNNIALLLLTISSELSDDISIGRLDMLIRVKAEEMRSMFGSNASGENEELIRSDIEKTIFYYLSRRLLIKTAQLPIKLSFRDFLYYSALSFFNSSAGDIRPISTIARLCTFIQVVGTFIILALAVAFLNNAVMNINEIQTATIRSTLLPVSIFIGIVLFIVIAVFLTQKCIKNVSYNKILRTPDDYGFTMRQDGTVDLMINISILPESCYLGHCALSMPYQAVVGESTRYPGFVITKDSIRIAWAELLPPTTNRLYVYGEGFDIGEIGDNFKLFIPGSFRAFSR